MFQDVTYTFVTPAPTAFSCAQLMLSCAGWAHCGAPLLTLAAVRLCWTVLLRSASGGRSTWATQSSRRRRRT